MKTFFSRQIIMPLVAVTVLTLSIVWMAGGFTDKVAPGLVNPAPQTSTDILDVSLTRVAKIEAAAATLTARETTLISSRIMARIDKISVRAGEQVTQGMPLITLESRDLLSQLDQAKARLSALQGSLREAQNNLSRTQNLREQGLASSADMDKAQAAYTRISGEIVAASQAQKEAETALSYSQINAPINGRIVDRSAEPGNMATPGKPLLSLYNPLSLQVEANVREALAINLQIGQELDVELESLGKTMRATISELVPAADPNAHSFVVKANILFDEQLRPGMFARLLIPLEDEELVLIPKAYVASFGQLDRVWVLNNQQLSRRFVRIGESYGEQLEIVSGLSAGEKISLQSN